MSLIRDAYRAEILDGLADAGEEVLHVFLEADAGVLKEQLSPRAPVPPNPETGQSAREWALSRLGATVAAAGRAGHSCCARTGSPRTNWPTRC
jgi:hypothetical protein